MDKLFTAAGLLAFGVLFAVPAHAQNRWYLGAEFGGGVAPGVTMNGNSNDRSSLCDEFINPQYASVPGCTDPSRGAGNGWKAEFAGAGGLIGNLSIGYQVRPWLRLEAEHSVWKVTYDDAALVGGATGSNQEKLTQEIFLARERLGTLSANGVFINVYLDHTLDERPFGLYVGAGGGVALTAAGYASLWARNKDVDAIKTGLDQPNGDEIRQNLAGTFSDGQTVMRAASPAIHLMVGADRHLSERFSIGFKAQYIMYLDFESDDLVWDPLRSHEPNIRKGGTEPVHGIYSTSDLSAVTVGLQLKHRF